MTSIKVKVTAVLSTAPGDAFTLVSDPARMPEWANGVQTSQWLEGSSLQPGGRFKMNYRYGKRTHDITMEILSVGPGHRLEYKTVEGPYPIHVDIRLEAAGNGTTISYTQTAFSDTKLAALGFILTGWFAKSMMRRVLKKDLRKLDIAAQAAVAGD